MAASRDQLSQQTSGALTELAKSNLPVGRR